MKTSMTEKIFYGLGGVGYQMTLALSNAFLTLYYTDSVLISASFVGTMMLAARLLDGASDIAMGFVIERTQTRFGKARPWVMIGALPLALSVVLLFNVPSGLAPLSKNVYVFLTYIFMSVICYTITALAHAAMLPRISLVSVDRNLTTVVLALMQGIMTAALVGVFAPLLKAFGGESSQNAWTAVSVMIAAASLLLLTLCFTMTKEKLAAAESGKSGTGTKKESVKAGLSFLLTSRYFYIIIFLYLTLAITNGTAGIGVYFMRDVLGDANLMGIFSITAVVSMIIMMPVVPKFFEMFGKRKTLIYSLSAVIAVKIVMLFFPANLPIQLICTFFGTLMVVPLWVATPPMICDLVDYGDYKRGTRTEGLTTSASSLGTKLGTGIGSMVLGAGLTMGGYDALANVQPQSAIDAIIFIMIGIPAILCALCLVLVIFWDLEKFKPEIEKYMEN
ncbi:MAG: glycoside-pentoside-hexuronide (GPH):cation symporter [Clostridiales bacterium]|jgi:GPH family glycoside/pentoside/hexuronide:cation symporter|nr:glycoside-pentoside-hexuronide (GPH):cation symporter [Clostridiales bacterium]